jgi:hypothetical protein
MNKYHAILLILLLCINSESRGDSCPSPDKIRHRDLSKQYEWTVDEKTSLKDLLSVKKLYAVRIMDHGSYVSCHYTTDKWPIKLDVVPAQGECTFSHHKGEWKSTESGQDVCMEKNAGKCEFTYTCKQTQ